MALSEAADFLAGQGPLSGPEGSLTDCAVCGKWGGHCADHGSGSAAAMFRALPLLCGAVARDTDALYLLVASCRTGGGGTGEVGQTTA